MAPIGTERMIGQLLDTWNHAYDEMVPLVQEGMKARATEDAAAFALDHWRLRRVAVAAERLAPKYMRDGDDIRIDAIFIVPGRLPRHLANVWQG